MTMTSLPTVITYLFALANFAFIRHVGVHILAEAGGGGGDNGVVIAGCCCCRPVGRA